MREIGVEQSNYRSYPSQVGAALIEVVEGWHSNVSPDSGVVLIWIKAHIWFFPTTAQAGTNYISSEQICLIQRH